MRPPVPPDALMKLPLVLLAEPNCNEPPGTAISIAPPAVVPVVEAALSEEPLGKVNDTGAAMISRPPESPLTLMVLVEAVP